MRIAQLIIFKLPQISLEQTTHLSNTKRQDKGFGSTGLTELLNKDVINDISNKHTAAAAVTLSDQ